jgi:hypothetical protein
MIIRLAFLCVLFFVSPLAQAATLYIDPPQPALNRGDAVTLSIRLDTDEAAGECINAIDGVISYNDAINPVDISIGQSIFPVWVEQPTIDRENRRITFAGGIPNGYCGRVEGDPRLTNTILQLVVRAPGLTVGSASTDSQGIVSFAAETKAYLNDGFGTEASLQTLGAQITLNQVVGNEIVDDWREVVAADTIPPEAFSITLERDDFAFNQEYYIVFNTTDKQSGISYYEVIEELPEQARLFGFGAATAPWLETRSPYILKDQTLRSTIRVRAIDKAGNEYIATLPPQNTGSAEDYWIVVGVGILGVAVLLVVFGWIWWNRRRKNISAIAAETETTIIT